jgi:glucan phosphoethanolaminetransferase (alkaline phosphatase superfamily)
LARTTGDRTPGARVFTSDSARATPLVLVRLLLFFAFAAIAGAAVLYLVKRDRRYLRFIGQVLKYTLLLLLGALLLYAAQRLLLIG